MPKNCDFSEAEKFIFQKEEWILEALSKVKNFEKKKTFFNENSVFSTKTHDLKLVKTKELQSKVKINIIKGSIMFYYPADADFQASFIQNAIRKAISETFRLEASAFLPVRTVELADKFGFSCGRVTVREAKTRWGSCSGENNISLNIYLMQLPDELIDYVILHELCHTKVKNHSSKFWDLLRKVAPKSDIYRKEMKKYSTTYF